MLRSRFECLFSMTLLPGVGVGGMPAFATPMPMGAAAAAAAAPQQQQLQQQQQQQQQQVGQLCVGALHVIHHHSNPRPLGRMTSCDAASTAHLALIAATTPAAAAAAAAAAAISAAAATAAAVSGAAASATAAAAAGAHAGADPSRPGLQPQPRCAGREQTHESTGETQKAHRGRAEKAASRRRCCGGGGSGGGRRRKEPPPAAENHRCHRCGAQGKYGSHPKGVACQMFPPHATSQADAFSLKRRRPKCVSISMTWRATVPANAARHVR